MNSKACKPVCYFLSVLAKQRMVYQTEDFRREKEVQAQTLQGAEDAH